jgi:hypothetical protein
MEEWSMSKYIENRWESPTNIKLNGDSEREFGFAITAALNEIGEQITAGLEDGLDAGAQLMIDALSAASPVRHGDLSKSWVANKYPRLRKIQNTVMVKGKSGDNINLAGLLEYSTVHGNPFIERTVDENIGKAAEVAVQSILNNIDGGNNNA